LIRRLVADGVDVTALARSAASATVVSRLGARPWSGEIGDKARLLDGMRGCDTVFHTAAHFTEWDAYQAFYSVNVEGTATLLEAAAEAGVGAFIACGAAGAVMGEPVPMARIRETTPLRMPTWAPYTATKAMAEQRVLAANSPALRTVSIVPPMIWGPGMPMLDEMLPLIESGKFALPDGGKHRVSTGYVDNVVEGLLLAARRGRGGEAYFIADDDEVTFAQLVADLLATRDLPAVTRSAPFAVAWRAAAVLETVWRAFKLKGKPPVTRQMLRMIGKEFTLDTSKARSELGYVPVVSRRDGLVAMRVGDAMVQHARGGRRDV
jgi:nucleoside-diphosphate-sugar epimerase